jgi:hypothetical protein
MAHFNCSIRLSTRLPHLWYSLPYPLSLSPTFCMPAAIARPCKYAMTKIGNSCFQRYNSEGKEIGGGGGSHVRGHLGPKTVGLIAEIIATSNMYVKSKWALHKLYASFFILFFFFVKIKLGPFSSPPWQKFYPLRKLLKASSMGGTHKSALCLIETADG